MCKRKVVIHTKLSKIRLQLPTVRGAKLERGQFFDLFFVPDFLKALPVLSKAFIVDANSQVAIIPSEIES